MKKLLCLCLFIFILPLIELVMVFLISTDKFWYDTFDYAITAFFTMCNYVPVLSAMLQLKQHNQ